MKEIGFYKNNKREGEWKFYYENGKLAQIGFYKNNKQDDEWKTYHQNGNLMCIGFFKNGDFDISKEQKLYYDNGNLERTYPQNGTGLSNVYFKNGKIKISGNYKNGKLIGECKEYYEDGRLKETSIYKIVEQVNEIAEARPAPDKEQDNIFWKVEQEAYFPGGDAAWEVFLKNTTNTNAILLNGATEAGYNVIVRFMVDKNGNVNGVAPETNYGHGLETEAVRIMEASPKWEPARQNGKKVSSYKQQTISFKKGYNFYYNRE